MHVLRNSGLSNHIFNWLIINTSIYLYGFPWPFRPLKCFRLFMWILYGYSHANKNLDECRACPAQDKSIFASQLLHLLCLGKDWSAVYHFRCHGRRNLVIVVGCTQLKEPERWQPEVNRSKHSELQRCEPFKLIFMACMALHDCLVIPDNITDFYFSILFFYKQKYVGNIDLSWAGQAWHS